ncbi:GGDEF domain-containing protein [Vibrio sp. SCSIO 43136]|uniref:GGDEF domain-containing protein n=1 Tax=Vibrio sp. SCSIO 43136 TaxID=2819101 RepID=UPI0020752533|nr:GGDEF domain-containing protein [Vibrio sp. SCSIO 43136]
MLSNIAEDNLSFVIHLPYLLFGVALLLCQSFSQGRMGMLAVAMTLAYYFVQTRLQVPLSVGTTRLEFSILAFLLPVACVIVYAFPNKRFFSTSGYIYSALMVGFALWGYLTITHFTMMDDHALWDGLLFTIEEFSRLPFLAVLYSIIFVGISAIMVLTRNEAIDSSVYSSLLFSTLTFCFFHLAFISSIFFTCAGILLIYNIISTSHKLAFIDQLTEIPSRRALENEMAHLGKHFAIAMLDVDHFKKFNDTHGHDTGDHVLRLVAKKMRATRGNAKVYRYGGEEFTVLFKGKDSEDTLEFLEELRESIAEYDMVVRNKSQRPKDDKVGSANRSSGSRDKTVKVTISIGVADTSHSRSPYKVLKVADEALYKAKKKGRNCVVAI